MKTKTEIQRTWDTAWFTPLADSQSLTFDVRSLIKAELRKEVFWVVTLTTDFDLLTCLNIRIDKIQALMDANDGSAASFYAFYDYRKAFFEWCAI